jgi:hypothetical protein
MPAVGLWIAVAWDDNRSLDFHLSNGRSFHGGIDLKSIGHPVSKPAAVAAILLPLNGYEWTIFGN